MNNTTWENLRNYLRLGVMPEAGNLDQDQIALESAFQGLGDRHLLALRVPQDLGGAGFSAAEYYQATVEMAAVSGILAFLQTQHQSAASRIARFGNPEQQTRLPDMARGKPMLQAIPQGDSYRLTGMIPWVTGYGFFQKAIAGATLPDGSELYGLIPLEICQQPEGGTITCSDPLPLAAMGASQTVTVHLENWLLSPADILVIQPPGTIHKGDRQQVLHHSFFALGCAQGVLIFLETTTFDKNDLALLKKHWQDLHQELFVALEQPSEESYQAKLELRLTAIQTAQNFAQIAMGWAGGAGNLLTSPAQRLYREAMMFSIFGQTQAIRTASIKSLLPRNPSGYTVIPNYAGVVQW